MTAIGTTAAPDPVAWLTAELAAGPRPAADVIAAADATGIGRKALRRAREQVCAQPRQARGGWHWQLAPQVPGSPGRSEHSTAMEETMAIDTPQPSVLDAPTTMTVDRSMSAAMPDAAPAMAEESPAQVTDAGGSGPLCLRRGWIPVTNLAWMEGLRVAHEAAVAGRAAAVTALGQLRSDHASEDAAFRARVQEAAAVSAGPPPRPATLDPAWRSAREAVALERVSAANAELLHVIEVALNVLVDRSPEVRTLAARVFNVPPPGVRDRHAWRAVGERAQVLALQLEMAGTNVRTAAREALSSHDPRPVAA